jgi:acetyltransferase-like isoleucine patch superfamily enzyme
MSNGRVKFCSERFYIHRSSYLEVAKDSKICFCGSVSIQKYVTIFLNEGSIANIGNAVYMGDYSTIRASRTTVSIGEHTIIGQGVKLIATNHAYQKKDMLIKDQDIDLKKIGILIGSDCWLGAGCIVLPGVTLGNGVVVGANSVVTKNVPDFAVVVGSPAKLLKFRT